MSDAFFRAEARKLDKRVLAFLREAEAILAETQSITDDRHIRALAADLRLAAMGFSEALTEAYEEA